MCLPLGVYSRSIGSQTLEMLNLKSAASSSIGDGQSRMETKCLTVFWSK